VSSSKHKEIVLKDLLRHWRNHQLPIPKVFPSRCWTFLHGAWLGGRLVLRLEGLVADTVVSDVPYDDTSRVTEDGSMLQAWRTVVKMVLEREAEDWDMAFVKESTVEWLGLSGRPVHQMIRCRYLPNLLTYEGDDLTTIAKLITKANNCDAAL
jgi:hypothetical protein